ncbi:MAG: system, mannose/fructose/sorbose family, subunit [Firmicutes bacterium]|jgi:PTS system mannose-specific IIA component|nr:system, mannose/fructose/sorbose family, subunit [Bacillota bacterium]
MLAVIVGTHGNFASELVKTCEMICGATTNVKAVTLVPGEGADDLAVKYEAALKELDTTDGVIFLNDLFGGSPYNAACRIAIQEEKYGIVTGVNLPMLIEMVSYQLCNPEVGDIKEVMEKAVEAGQAGTQTFHLSTIQNDEEEDDL